MKKHTYRMIPIGDLNLERVVADASGADVVVAIDVAKVDMAAAIVARDRGVLATVRWKAPLENAKAIEMVRDLRAAGVAVQVALEPSGTYGDVLRHHLAQHDVEVYRVSGKRTHDAREVYDGVPSLHDAKSAAIIAKLHFDGASALWPTAADTKRRLQASITRMEMFKSHHLRLVHMLEGWTARHWPEVTSLVELTAPTLLALLARLGGPNDVAADPGGARKLMHSVSNGLMVPAKIDAVVASAAATVGVPLVDEERSTLQALAGEAHRALLAFKAAKGRVEELSESASTAPVAKVVGKATAAVFEADVGPPTEFTSTGAYLKAFGINMKEKSSGTQKGNVAITKRGPPRARQWLWLAALRWLMKDRNAKAWFDKKVARDGGKEARALVSVMRKLAMGIFHVARGATFDSAKLFDVSRLNLAS